MNYTGFPRISNHLEKHKNSLWKIIDKDKYCLKNYEGWRI